VCIPGVLGALAVYIQHQKQNKTKGYPPSVFNKNSAFKTKKDTNTSTGDLSIKKLQKNIHVSNIFLVTAPHLCGVPVIGAIAVW